jgi:hypothetical protein
MHPELKAPETHFLIIRYDELLELLSSFAFNFNLRRYNLEKRYRAVSQQQAPMGDQFTYWTPVRRRMLTISKP